MSMMQPPRFPPGAFRTGQEFPPEVSEAILQLRDLLLRETRAIELQVEQLQILQDILRQVFLAGRRATTPTVRTNISADDILDLLMQGAYEGQLRPTPATLDITVPAGTTVDVVFSAYPGYVIIIPGITLTTASFHSALITIDLFLDGRSVFPLPITLAEDRAKNISRLQYASRLFPIDNLMIRIINGAGLATTVHIDATTIDVEKSLHDQVVIPTVLKASREVSVIQGVVQSQ